MADIVRVSGQTRRAFYELFEDREELLRIVEREEVADRLIELMAAARGSDPGGWPTAERVLDVILRFYTEDPRRAHVAWVAVAGVSTVMEEHRRQSTRAVGDVIGELLGDRAGKEIAARRAAGIALGGALGGLLSDFLWIGGGSLDLIRDEMRAILRSRFFDNDRTSGRRSGQRRRR